MSRSKSNITIAIIGGGLGGITAAIALGRVGYSGMHPFVLIQSMIMTTVMI
jgi:cation diffusion facilitator CzcD-associated flavoprotein CzcO